jgi:hypothetical protein
MFSSSISLAHWLIAPVDRICRGEDDRVARAAAAQYKEAMESRA